MHVLRVALRRFEPPVSMALPEEAAQEPDDASLLLDDVSRREVLADGEDFARIKVRGTRALDFLGKKVGYV